jgi:CPA1 family monovalent cation:H+ antiporter
VNTLDLAAALLSLTAIFAFVNARFIRLPHSITLLLMGLASSLVLVGVDLVFPGLQLTQDLRIVLAKIDFTKALMQGAVAFLLFAGCLQVDLATLRTRALSVGVLSTLSLLISTAIIGFGFRWITVAMGVPVPLGWSLVFGALISPTDPIAVQTILKTVLKDDGLRIDMMGESLFNDGVAVVLFTVLAAMAEGRTVQSESVFETFAIQSAGGACLGLVLGWTSYKAMSLINDYAMEMLITLALVTGAYSLAGHLHVSGAITVVGAGLLVGDRGDRGLMSETTKRYLFGFWALLDEMLNAVLYMLVGMEVLVLRFAPSLAAPAAGAVLLCLLARFVSVAVPVTAMRRWYRFPRGSVTILTWGGVRGGISIAMAMSLPEFPQKSVLLSATYAAVVFSVVVQGISLDSVIRAVDRRSGGEPDPLALPERDLGLPAAATGDMADTT